MTFSDADNDIKRGFFFLGAQSLGADTNRNLRYSLRARVVAAASTCTGSLWLVTAHSLLRRADLCCLRTLLTARRICRMAADRSHDSTFAVDDGRTTTNPLGRAVPATFVRASSLFCNQRSRTVFVVHGSAESSQLRIAPGLLLVSVYFDQRRLASACDV